MKTLGIDLSLRSTGIVILCEDGKVELATVIKSRPRGDQPIDEIKRILQLVDDIFNAVYIDNPKDVPDLAIIENVAYMAKGTSLVQLSALNYMVRARLLALKCRFIICAPTSLKKFITGSGKGEKDHVMMAIYKDYGFESMDNNVGDAFGLAAAGLAIMDRPLKKLTVPQTEVIKLLKKQYE